jgi:cytosine/adenosine deaminase-related metal-dependent hydrolase
MRKSIFSADRILSPDGKWIEDQVIVTDESGTILDIADRDPFESSEIDYRPGALVPGFVNAHCHLELSHMKGMIPTGTGLVPFIQTVVSQRETSPEGIRAAIAEANREMEQSGIVAVGDISNVEDSFQEKTSSPLRYYTFIEVFDFMQKKLTQDSFRKAVKNSRALKLAAGDKKAIVPHAPYSVSSDLFEQIRKHVQVGDRMSIHNQELVDEDRMFQTGKSSLIDFFESAGFDMSGFVATGETSLRYALAQLKKSTPTLFVHNTQTPPADIAFAEQALDEVYWVSCPNANLYIENQLPNYEAFIRQDAKVALGTDSLASNWQLSILEEIKTIKKYNSYIPTTTLLTWATKNGAEALGFEDTLGTLEVDKTPGILHLSTTSDTNWEVNEGARVERLI